MKPAFKCEYCNFIGTKEEVEEHEKVCIDNPDVKCCQNCKYSYSYDFYDSTEPRYYCLYKPYMNHSRNILCNGEPIPKENICEYYERGSQKRKILL